MELTTITVLMAIGLFTSTPAIELEPNRIAITDLWIEQFEGVDYVRGIYDCTQFSNDFRDTLEPYLNVSVVYGMFIGSENTHCWLEIEGKWFEATSGHWVEDRDRYKMFKYVPKCW